MNNFVTKTITFVITSRMDNCDEEDSTTISSCVRGYHVYNQIWNPSVGDGLDCQQDSTNTNDCYAVYLPIGALCFAKYFQ